MYVTLEKLRKLRACPNQVKLFEKWITERGIRRVKLCTKELQAAGIYGLDITWYIDIIKYRYTGKLVIQNTTQYYKNGVLHRTNGPAYISGEYKSYYVNGLRHRVNGPAISCKGYAEWFIKGTYIKTRMS